jgi:F-type H+-transporting ATPase subunit b
VLLDPFTVIAQILNFAVLVIVLKVLLYDRVVQAMDEREAGIAQRLEQADDRREQAEERSQRLYDRERELERQAESMVDEARHEAQERRRELLTQAREQVDEQREHWHRALEQDRADLREELSRRTAVVVVDLTRTALADLADADLESAVIERALHRLNDDETAQSALLAEGGRGRRTLVVRSAFPLQEQAESVIGRLRELTHDDAIEVRFEQEQRLILGVELNANGTALDWNAHDYLARLESSIDELLDEVLGRAEDDHDG